MPTIPTDWKQRSPEELIELVLETNARFKLVGIELQQRAPSEAAAQRLIDAYEAGDAEPWFTAHLLGCVGHEVGYDTVRAILLASPGRLAESYAGPALGEIGGPRAHDDLVRFTKEGPTRRSREGAAYGLPYLGTGEAAAALIDAALSGAIGYGMGSTLIDLPVSAERIVELLDGEERSRRVAIAYVTRLISHAADAESLAGFVDDGYRIGARSRHARSQEATKRLAVSRGHWLAAVQRLLADEDFRMAPRQRTTLTKWVH